MKKASLFVASFLMMCVNAFALTINTNDIADGAVTTSKIADGAVTDAKIQGKISASKLETAANIVVVAKSGGDYTSITEAMNAISPTESSPYVIKIAPGSYTDAANGGSEVFPITMKAFVSLIGSGANNTKIYSSNGHVFSGDSSGVLIENLTLESSNGGGLFLWQSSAGKETTLLNSKFLGKNGYAAYIGSTDSVSVNNCEFSGTEGIGIQGAATVVIANSRFIQTAPYTSDNGADIYVTGNAVINNNFFRGFAHAIGISSLQAASYVVIDNADMDRAVGIWDSTPVLIKNSRMGAGQNGMSIHANAGNMVKVASSMIEGTVSPEVRLINCFDGNLDPIANQ